ncbi:uncharacterized protein LOC131927200 [Physella acuta]|uniref:uncharacterized protein LOC131927200 n=1 Tax=Physella acuta TaxID=109671 RepID=UPI0027DCFB87|nr:uncharacterized protein LOC131927200 [Physella acuta]
MLGTNRSSSHKLSMVSCPVCSANHLPIKGSLKNGVYACTCENCGHFFKFKAVQNFKSTVTFTINGVSYTVGNEYHPATSLNEYMRHSGASVGTKGCCYEGGCGVCLVTVKLFEPISAQKVEYAVNSCCLQLYTCDGMEITTIEGLGNTKDGLHPIQDRMVKHDGTQCGFCTPGQIMNMYGLLKRFPTPTVQQIEDEFDATLCRCTGYRAILDAMKTFAVDAPPALKGKLIDIEELDGKICKKSGQACTGHCNKNKTGKNGHCENQIERPVHIVGDGTQWFKPTSLQDLIQLLNQHRADKYRLVFGNTSFGVYQEFGPWNFNTLIDIRGVQELYTIKNDTSVTLGANLSISNLIEVFEQYKTQTDIPYAATFAEHLHYVAQHGIRNMSSWAGNLLLKLAHPEFASDIFTILETVGATLLIYDGDGSSRQYSLTEFLGLDMKGKVIVSATLPKFSTSVKVQTYKTSHRLQACKAYVNAGFMMDIDVSRNFMVKSKPSIVIQGINSQLIHAVQTESFLISKSLGDPAMLQNALTLLASELIPETHPTWASPTYRKSLAVGMFYKFVLSICSNKVSPRYTSGATGLTRTPIVGTQDYGTDPSEYPVTQALPKVTAQYLTSGTALFLDDLPAVPGQLNAAAVISTVGNAEIDTIDPSIALSLPGVVAFLKASDIPKGGINNWRPKSLYIFKPGTQELLSSGVIEYAGQPIGIIVADVATTAQTAASLVNVTYKNVQVPIVDLKDGVQKKSFFPDPPDPTTVGDPKGAIASAPRKVSGSIGCGDQFHFYLETPTVICTPSDVGGMKVKATSQWLDGVGETVSQVLGLPQSSVEVTAERLGGGFGGKISQPFLVSGLCSLAAYAVNKPVKMNLDIHTNMKMLGKRDAYYAEYEVGFDNNGLLLGIIINVYTDAGVRDLEGDGNELLTWIDNAYYCPNWLFTPVAVKTNKPAGTACRSPGSTAAIFIMESIIEHVAKSLGRDPYEVRRLNLYVKGQKTPSGMPLNYCTIREVAEQFESDINLTQRQQAVATFNTANRWKKRGLALMPNRFGIGWQQGTYNTHIMIYHADGSVAIAHGGIDMGQGINTKVIQVCAYELGIPMDKIRVQTFSTVINANSTTTGGSITSELCCMGVIEACNILKQRMAPVKAKMVNPTWQELVSKCYDEMVDLTASFMTAPQDPYASRYNCYSIACVEAELDILTGQYQLRQMDMLYDCGDSINPELDIGQAEGGFIMGMGYFLQEQMIFDPVNGQALNAGTWEYKPPMPKDLPMNFNFKFLRNAPNPLGVLRSKAVGEPPLTMGACALFAIKHAVEAARAEIGQDTYFPLDSPATVDKVQLLCLNDISKFTLGN